MAKKKLDFEQATQRLEEILTLLDNGDIALEKAMELYKEGLAMAEICDKYLAQAHNEMKIYTKSGWQNAEIPQEG